MTTSTQLILTVLLVGFLLVRNLPGALAFLRPAWIRTRPVGGPDAVSPHGHGMAVAEMIDSLEDLDFAPQGAMVEERPLARSQKELVLAREEDHAYAGVIPVRDEAGLRFFTVFEGGRVVITTDYRVPAVEEADYMFGGLPGASAAEVWNTHKRRVARMVEAGARPVSGLSLEGRVAAARAFYATGPGRREVRRREARAFMFSLFSVALLVSAVAGFFRNR